MAVCYIGDLWWTTSPGRQALCSDLEQIPWLLTGGGKKDTVSIPEPGGFCFYSLESPTPPCKKSHYFTAQCGWREVLRLYCRTRQAQSFWCPSWFKPPTDPPAEHSRHSLISNPWQSSRRTIQQSPAQSRNNEQMKYFYFKTLSLGGIYFSNR